MSKNNMGGEIMAAYQCPKCGNTFEEPEINETPGIKDKTTATKVKDEKKCCPSCVEMGDLCKDYEEDKADRYD
jgi:hypothetical protein